MKVLALWVWVGAPSLPLEGEKAWVLVVTWEVDSPLRVWFGQVQ